jgi:hypothetical protein
VTGDPAVKLPGHPADRVLVPQIGLPEPAGSHAAQMPAGLDQENVEAEVARADRRDDSRGCTSVHDHVGGLERAALSTRNDRQSRGRENRGSEHEAAHHHLKKHRA